MGKLRELFQGISVVIDDQIDTADSGIFQIISNLERHNCHVVKLKELPKITSAKYFDGASFFILDWNFHPAPAADEGVRMGENFRRSYEADNIAFLKALKEVQFAPIFIFTNEQIDAVKTKLKENDLINEDDGDHIFVMNKADVLGEKLFETLEKWIQGHPSAYVLKKWDQAYAKAKNSLFNSFYESSRYWPVVIWETHLGDGVSPSVELGNLIARNIDSRMNPVDFDPFILAQMHKHQIPDITSEEIRNVLAGERFIKDEFLDSKSYSTGDIFRKNAEKYYINIRPECDCVTRTEDEADSTPLYLLSGSPITNSQVNKIFKPNYGALMEPDEAAIIFAVCEGKTLRFNFKSLEILTVKQIKADSYIRKGRLIPPYVTRLVQRYAAYTQRFGLPRIPDKAIPPAAKEEITITLNQQHGSGGNAKTFIKGKAGIVGE